MKKCYKINLELVPLYKEDDKMALLELEENKECLEIIPEELKERFLAAQSNKYKIDKECADKIHNNISLIVHYNKIKNHNKYKLFTLLAQYIIDDFVVRLINRCNDYLTSIYDIKNICLEDIESKEGLDKFKAKLESINQPWLTWFYKDFFKEQESIANDLLVNSIEDVVRIKKIGSNILKKIDRKDKKSSEYIAFLCQAIYQFSDKLKMNNFVKEQNSLLKELYDLYCFESEKFDEKVKIDGDKMTIITDRNIKDESCNLNIKSSCDIYIVSEFKNNFEKKRKYNFKNYFKEYENEY